MIHTLPEPTWTQSENNLLPKWLRFVTDHHERHGNPALNEAIEYVTSIEETIQTYRDYVKSDAETIAAAKKEIARLKAIEPITDEQLLMYYEQLLELPEVIGVRIDEYGALVILVNPILKDREDDDAGLYEIDRRTPMAKLRIVRCSRELRNTSFVDYSTIGRGDNGHVTISFHDLSGDVANVFATSYDVVSYVKEFSKALSSHLIHQTLPKRDANTTAPWEGVNVASPVQALRKLVESQERANVKRLIEHETERLSYAELEKKRDMEHLRRLQRQLGERKTELAEIRKRIAEAGGGKIDVEKAKQMLRYISTLPGVIAIKFDGNTPVLHVRCSFPYRGKRYDLGDFELYLKSEDKQFGTVLTVRRTRTPLGGTYERGWHTNQNAFCFGSRNEDIMTAFREGAFDDAVTGAIGTMCTIENSYQLEYNRHGFAEIEPSDVWRRKPRMRARRIARAMGATATKLVDMTT